MNEASAYAYAHEERLRGVKRLRGVLHVLRKRSAKLPRDPVVPNLRRYLDPQNLHKGVSNHRTSEGTWIPSETGDLGGFNPPGYMFIVTHICQPKKI